MAHRLGGTREHATNRARARALNLAILVGAAVQTRTTAPPGVDILRGRALELVDERGRPRARIDGSSIKLVSQDGHERLIAP